MFIKSKKSVYGEFAIAVTLLSVLCACSPSMNLRSGDIRSSEDSILVGRIRFLPQANCVKAYQLPAFKLRNITTGKCTPFATPDWTELTPGQSIDIPISLRAIPGAHDLRIEVERGLWDSVWLDEHLLPLVRFEVPKGLLVYIGTIEVELSCEVTRKRGQAHYAGHTIRDEFDQEILLFKVDFPKIYEMYKDRVIHAEPQEPWKKL